MLRLLAVLLFIVGGGIVAVIVLATILVAVIGFAPSDRVTVPLPMANAVAHVERWSGFDSVEVKLVVETPAGSVDRRLWDDWGPAGRVNLYRTPEDWLVALGGVDGAAMVELKANELPRLISYPRKPSGPSETWTYLGAVDRNRGGPWRFFRPEEKPECFAMRGVGGSPYRTDHQASSCD